MYKPDYNISSLYNLNLSSKYSLILRISNSFKKKLVDISIKYSNIWILGLRLNRHTAIFAKNEYNRSQNLHNGSW